MATSILIAKLSGPVLLVAALAMLADAKGLKDLAQEFLESRALIYLSGVLVMIGGLAIVNTHNDWRADWPVIITLLGWAMVIGGGLRMALPSVVQSIGTAMMKRAGLIRVAGALWALVGAVLCYQGYVAAQAIG